MKATEKDLMKARAALDSGYASSVTLHDSKDGGVTWHKADVWVDHAGETVCGHSLADDGKTYTITVEALSTATITVRAESSEQALAWAQTHAVTAGLMNDDVPEYDWPTAKVREH
jgi:hypothetical protein